MPRITIIGPGAIGCAIGGALTQSGHAVTFCGRRAFSRLSVQQDDAVPVLYPAWVATGPKDVPPADWVLVCVKAFSVPATADWLAAAVGPGTRVAVLQNGVEQKENVEPFVPPGTPVVPVVVDLPVSRSAPGVVRWTRIASVVVPEGPDGAAFAALFNGSFVSAETSPDFVTRAWMKLCNNAPSGAILALTGQRMRVMQAPGIAELARAILKEVVAVGRAEGATLDDGIIERQLAAFLSATGDEGNSMYADRMAGREMEWNARNGVIVRKAAQHGIAVPVSAALVPLLAAMSDAAKTD
jgi:2-dehydropantoate 2-reductase